MNPEKPKNERASFDGRLFFYDVLKLHQVDLLKARQTGDPFIRWNTLDEFFLFVHHFMTPDQKKELGQKRANIQRILHMAESSVGRDPILTMNSNKLVRDAEERMSLLQADLNDILGNKNMLVPMTSGDQDDSWDEDDALEGMGL